MKKYYLVIRKVTTVSMDSCYVKAENEDDACDIADHYEFNEYDLLRNDADVDYDVQEVSKDEAVRNDVIDLYEDDDYDEEEDEDENL